MEINFISDSLSSSLLLMWEQCTVGGFYAQLWHNFVPLPLWDSRAGIPEVKECCSCFFPY